MLEGDALPLQFLHCGLNGRLQRHVHHHPSGWNAMLAFDLGCDLEDALGNVPRHNANTFLGKQLRGRQSDAAGCTRNDDSVATYS
jgi:hypothetical protein